MKFNYEIDGNKTSLDICSLKNGFKLSIGSNEKDFIVRKVKNKNYVIIGQDGKVYDVFVENRDDGNHVFFKGTELRVKDSNATRKRGGFEIEGEITIKSPLPRQIKKILRSDGDEVETGDSIVVLEAMKMENEIKSPKSGVVKKIHVEENSTVTADSNLFTIE